MDVKWTSEQKKVIDLRDRDILVSAAAGSGKTAVLVERIVNRICVDNPPVDIDRMLVVTFTKAAAAEMRERVSRAIDSLKEQKPDDENLQRQSTLVHNALITTIDSFCLFVVQNNFAQLNLDPDFRIGDQAELKLMLKDALAQVFEDNYAREDNEEFINLIDTYSKGRNDSAVRQMVEDIYYKAGSSSWPRKWMNSLLRLYDIKSAKQLEDSEIIKEIVDYSRVLLEEAVQELTMAKDLASATPGLEKYALTLSEDIALFDGMADVTGYVGMQEFLNKISFGRIAVIRKFDGDEKKKERVKSMRDATKKKVDGIKQKYFGMSIELMYEQLERQRPFVKELIRLSLEFYDAMEAVKTRKRVFDFSDIEHFALRILVDEQTLEPTETAREFSKHFEEIMIDEYQDSNQVQEDILTAISREHQGVGNMFMVGDVKQSIYRFRMARPELFMEKYNTYTSDDSAHQRIDLHKNFRSRNEVLDFTNDIFYKIMAADLGNVQYDDDAALYPGASYPDETMRPELLLVDYKDEDLSEIIEDEDGDKVQIEALLIANRIRSLMENGMVTDKKTGQLRAVQYRDIVILSRSVATWGNTVAAVLKDCDIPAHVESNTGYFSSYEIQVILSMLRILDNPLQDIPLMGVLRSPIVGCTSQELAELRIQYPDGLLYESVSAYAGENEIPEKELDPDKLKSELLNSNLRTDEKNSLNIKLKGFLSLLEKVRNMAAYTPVHQLILEVLERTGYGNHAKAMPDGAQRSANLNMLVEKAMEYEKTSYRGLFNFVRYIQKLQQYQVDYGEVNLSGAGESAVQIMTIHKSKGLEFPVVFAAGMGKRFNFRDMNASILIHPDLGIGADAILPEKRIIASSLCKQIIRRELLKESLGEELRVLYVALTRAKEKLILCGTVGDLEQKLTSLSVLRDSKEELLSLGLRMRGKTYWDYVLPSLARHRCMSSLFHEYGIFMNRMNPLYGDPSEFVVTKITAQDLTENEIVEQAEREMKKETLENWNPGRVFDSEIREEIERRFSFIYPYQYLEDLPVKVSVSELKKRSYHSEQDLEETVDYETEEEIQPIVPRFIEEKKEEGYTGALRGTAYHRVMECLDYGHAGSQEEIRSQLREWVDNKKMERKEAESVRVRDIWNFVESSLGQRMKAASEKKLLFREQPFVIARKASELEPEWQCEEDVLVQGIIDGYFIEDEEIVLVDYKTDFVRRGEEQKLIDRYRVQLEDYAQALERMTGRKVKERYIYSFTLGKEILL